MKNLKESDIQRACCEWLAAKTYFFWRSNNIPAPLPGGKGFRSLPKFTPRGIPDIFILDGGRIIGIEVKRPAYDYDDKKRNITVVRRSNLTDAQKWFEEQMIKNGAYYFVVHSVDELENVLGAI